MSTEYSFINCPDCEETQTGQLIGRRNNVGHGKTHMILKVNLIVVQNRLDRAGINKESKCIKGSDGREYTYPEFHELMSACDGITDKMIGITV